MEKPMNHVQPSAYWETHEQIEKKRLHERESSCSGNIAVDEVTYQGASKDVCRHWTNDARR